MNSLFLILVSGYGVGALAALLGFRQAYKRALSAAGAAVGSAAGLALGMVVILSAAPFSVSVSGLLPMAGGLALRLDGLGAFFLILIGLRLLLLVGLAPLALALVRVNRRLRVSGSWGCGRVGQTPRMEYTATAFAEPLVITYPDSHPPIRTEKL